MTAQRRESPGPNGGRRADRGRGLDAERVVFFSDAVFAIAMTLLVIDLRIPEMPMRQAVTDLPAAILGMWPKFFSFVLSFAVLAVYWVAHHRMFRHIIAVDPGLLWLNLLFLLFIVFVPFPTALLGAYGDLRFVVVFYALSQALVGFTSAILWRYASKDRRLIATETPESLVRYLMRRALTPGAVFLTSVPLAWISPRLAMYAWALSWPTLAIWRRVLKKEPGGANAD